MLFPDYWLTRPGPEPDAGTRLAFEALLESSLRAGECPTIEYHLPAPKWQFLSYLAEHYKFALHGSGNPDIALFEPRQSNDLGEFGSQKAVYAASDGIWAMFFAVVDRDRIGTITNACAHLTDEAGARLGPYYFFSISRDALRQQPWRTGTLYLLPSETFVPQPPVPFGPYQVHFAQLASLAPITPFAKLTVAPQDFPFLAQIRGHDDNRLQEYADALMSGAPLPDDPATA